MKTMKGELVLVDDEVANTVMKVEVEHPDPSSLNYVKLEELWLDVFGEDLYIMQTALVEGLKQKYKNVEVTYPESNTITPHTTWVKSETGKVLGMFVVDVEFVNKGQAIVSCATTFK